MILDNKRENTLKIVNMESLSAKVNQYRDKVNSTKDQLGNVEKSQKELPEAHKNLFEKTNK
jgi:prefoldin subunit 5